MTADLDYEQFIENGRRWRELLPKGRYAWPLYDWNIDYNVDHDDGPPLIGYAVHWRRRNGSLSTFITAADKACDIREIASALQEAAATDENMDREFQMAAIVENPGKYAGRYGMHSGNCGFCGRKLTDPASVERGIGPECLKKLAVTE
ncbi:MAG: hypothetical protein K0U84_05675 [Actinomycetia bacterium]|nr:hypothetical protein [Actinomycetes bacterium]